MTVAPFPACRECREARWGDLQGPGLLALSSASLTPGLSAPCPAQPAHDAERRRRVRGSLRASEMVSGAVVFPRQRKGEEADGQPIVFCFFFFFQEWIIFLYFYASTLNFFIVKTIFEENTLCWVALQPHLQWLWQVVQVCFQKETFVVQQHFCAAGCCSKNLR